MPEKVLVNLSNIKSGLRVFDNEGNIGFIEAYDSKLHDVYVIYDNGGSGFHCLNEHCTEDHSVSDELVAKVNYYDPLFLL